jgi:predicted nucleic acid-binding protein
VLADYELRRAFTAADATESLQQYDELAKHLRLVPIAVDAATKAVDLHRAHTSGKRVSDADVLMLAQATIENAILITTDQDLLRLGATRAADWHDIQFPA